MTTRRLLLPLKRDRNDIYYKKVVQILDLSFRDIARMTNKRLLCHPAFAGFLAMTPFDRVNSELVELLRVTVRKNFGSSKQLSTFNYII
jgi:hypothetical protein